MKLDRLAQSRQDLSIAINEVATAIAELHAVQMRGEPTSIVERQRVMSDPISRLALAWRAVGGVLARHGWKAAK